MRHPSGSGPSICRGLGVGTVEILEFRMVFAFLLELLQASRLEYFGQQIISNY